MTLLLVIVGLALLMLPGRVARYRGSLTSRRWVRLCRGLLGAGVGVLLAGLVLWALPILVHWADRFGVPGLCDEAFHRLPLGGFEVALLAGLAFGALLARIVTALVTAETRRRTARIDPHLGRHRRMAGYDVVVVPSSSVVAAAIPGDEPQIVLSEQLVAVLEPPEVAAVIRHEMAHHRLDHERYLLLAASVDYAFGWLPPVRASLRALRQALEEWADEASAGSSPERIEVLRSALSRLADTPTTSPGRQAIQARIKRLDGHAPDCSTVVAETVAGVGFAFGAALVVTAFVSQMVVALSQCRV